MRLVSNWKEITLYAYSMWAQYLAFGALITPELLFYLAEIDTNPRIWYFLALTSFVTGTFGRVITQDKIPSENQTTLLSSVWIGVGLALLFSMAQLPQRAAPPNDVVTPIANEIVSGPSYEQTVEFLTPLVKKWEGKHPCNGAAHLHCSYFDTIAKPPLWTVGYGHTQTASEGQRLTEAQATDLLARDLRVYWAGVRLGFTKETVALRLTPMRDAAYTSLGYNVGVAGVRKSTATRRLNDGDIAGGCQAITWWNKAGGRVIRGLVNRRKEEYAMCMAEAV